MRRAGLDDELVPGLQFLGRPNAGRINRCDVALHDNGCDPTARCCDRDFNRDAVSGLGCDDGVPPTCRAITEAVAEREAWSDVACVVAAIPNEEPFAVRLGAVASTVVVGEMVEVGRMVSQPYWNRRGEASAGVGDAEEYESRLADSKGRKHYGEGSVVDWRRLHRPNPSSPVSRR